MVVVDVETICEKAFFPLFCNHLVHIFHTEIVLRDCLLSLRPNYLVILKKVKISKGIYCSVHY